MARAVYSCALQAVEATAVIRARKTGTGAGWTLRGGLVAVWTLPHPAAQNAGVAIACSVAIASRHARAAAPGTAGAADGDDKQGRSGTPTKKREVAEWDYTDRVHIGRFQRRYLWGRAEIMEAARAGWKWGCRRPCSSRMTSAEEQVRQRFALLRSVVDERQTRLWAAAEAMALGYGGGAIVTRATGIRSKRISRGRKDLQELERTRLVEKPREQRVRRPGAGRKPLEESDPTLWADLETMVEPLTRGDPESPLRWTAKSTRKLAEELSARGHRVSARTVAKLLAAHDYSLQGTRKTVEGEQHPDRNAQFEHINRQTKTFHAADQPVISVDTKKK